MDIDPVDLPEIRILHQFLQLVHLLLCELDLLAEGRGDTAGAILQHCQIVGVVVLKGRLRRHAGIDIVGDPCVVERDLHLTHGEVRKLFFRPRVRVVLRRIISGRRRRHILAPCVLDPVMSSVPVSVRPGVGDDPVLRLVVVHVLVDKGILELQLRLISEHAALVFLFCGIASVVIRVFNGIFRDLQHTCIFVLLVPGSLRAAALRHSRCLRYSRAPFRPVHRDALSAGSKQQRAGNQGGCCNESSVHPLLLRLLSVLLRFCFLCCRISEFYAAAFFFHYKRPASVCNYLRAG